MATTLIKGGTVVSATGRGEADVLIDGETIAAVLAPGSQLLGTDVAASVDRVIDASGKYVIPGGIDAHTHMQLPFGGTEASDTFESGTIAAAQLIAPKTTYGVSRNSGEALLATTASLRNSLRIVRYGSISGGARRPVSHARHWLTQPTSSGASASAKASWTACERRAVAVTG